MLLETMNELDLQTKLNQCHQYFNNQEFDEASELYQELMLENDQLRSGLSIHLAHCLILQANWQKISSNLINGINYLSTSGWLNSLFRGKPINSQDAPIPWYTYPAIEFLEDKIKPDSIVFEFGAGNSTLWWGGKAKQVISIESDQAWYDQIKQQMPDNVQLNLEIDKKKYADFINQYPDQYFDVIIIDGINRNACLENSLNKLKHDGLLIFDNTDDHRYDNSLKLLSSKDFKRIDFYGLIPSYTYKNCTSLFFKSTEILETQKLPSEKKSCLGQSCFQITNPKMEEIKQEQKRVEVDSPQFENTINSLLPNNLVVRVDLGCGTHKSEGFIGVDIVVASGVDVVADLNESFPFPDNSVDVIKAHDFIEHLPNRIQTMNELWRILKPDGIVDILVPSTDGRGAFQDPTHVSYWNINSFMYYCQEYPEYLAGCQSHYGFQGRFNIVNLSEIESPGKVIHIQAQLKAIKSQEADYPINFKNINFIVFPDWKQSLEVNFNQLLNVCQVIINHPRCSEIALLIDIKGIELENMEFLLADILLSLSNIQRIETENGNEPEFNLLKINSNQECKGILPLLYSRIILEYENKELINSLELRQLASHTLEEINSNPI
jgi:SAM-dependent methyltransferase